MFVVLPKLLSNGNIKQGLNVWGCSCFSVVPLVLEAVCRSCSLLLDLLSLLEMCHTFFIYSYKHGKTDFLTVMLESKSKPLTGEKTQFFHLELVKCFM